MFYLFTISRDHNTVQAKAVAVFFLFFSKMMAFRFDKKEKEKRRNT